MTEGVRQFPCSQCGAKVEFAPGTDSLVCPYCGNRTELPKSTDGIEERDFHGILGHYLPDFGRIVAAQASTPRAIIAARSKSGTAVGYTSLTVWITGPWRGPRPCRAAPGA